MVVLKMERFLQTAHMRSGSIKCPFWGSRVWSLRFKFRVPGSPVE